MTYIKRIVGLNSMFVYVKLCYYLPVPAKTFHHMRDIFRRLIMGNNWKSNSVA